MSIRLQEKKILCLAKKYQNIGYLLLSGAHIWWPKIISMFSWNRYNKTIILTPQDEPATKWPI